MSAWQTVLTCEQHHSLDASRALATTKAAARKVDLDDLKLGGLGPGPVAAAIASARLRLKSDCLGCEPPTAPGAPKCVCPSYPAPGGLFPRVRLLDLSNNGIGVAGARMLAAALASGDVRVPETLRLGNNALGPLGVGVLAGVLGEKMRESGGAVVAVRKKVSMTELVDLDLSRNGMLMPGLQALVQGLAGITTLTRLNVSRNAVRRDGCVCVCVCVCVHL